MIKIFIDFDGTITRQDIGDSMFETFGGKQCVGLIEDYRAGKISAIECFRSECASCSGTDKNKLNIFLDSQDIDSTFHDFIDFCRHHEFECYILSDGMDYYVDYILRKNGIKDVTFYANHLELVPLNGTERVIFQPSFPHMDEVCNRCADCKRNHILTLCSDEDIIIYIGEGYSDRCPAHYADIVFAKDDLRKYCQEKNISFFEYRSFADISQRLKSLPENRIKKCRRAQLAARDVYLGG